MEVTLEGTKFWLLEKKPGKDGEKSEKWIYGDEESLSDKLKELLEITDVDNIYLCVVDITKKDEWSISTVDWSNIVAMIYKKKDKK